MAQAAEKDVCNVAVMGSNFSLDRYEKVKMLGRCMYEHINMFPCASPSADILSAPQGFVGAVHPHIKLPAGWKQIHGHDWGPVMPTDAVEDAGGADGPRLEGHCHDCVCGWQRWQVGRCLSVGLLIRVMLRMGRIGRMFCMRIMMGYRRNYLAHWSN